MAVADKHEVWVISRKKNVAALREFLNLRPEGQRVHLVALDLGPWMLRLKRLGALGLQFYYDRWQSRAGAIAHALNEQVPFDVAHHVTFSSDWTRAGISTVPTRFVWGPVGGGVNAPAKLLPTLGWRGVLTETIRVPVRWAMRFRPSSRSNWRAADVVLVQNAESAALAPRHKRVVLLPHSTALSLQAMPPTRDRTKEIAVVGRLIAWKGGLLALSAFRRIKDPGATLTFFGRGPEQRRLMRAAAKWGLSDRVSFEGSIPRERLLLRVAQAGAVIHAAVHDESPLAVGEALTLGTPVVCLKRGGPAELLRRWTQSPGHAVDVGSPATTASRIASAVDAYLADPPSVPLTPLVPQPSFAESLLRVYESPSGPRELDLATN